MTTYEMMLFDDENTTKLDEDVTLYKMFPRVHPRLNLSVNLFCQLANANSVHSSEVRPLLLTAP
jgi:hypothetical protein